MVERGCSCRVPKSYFYPVCSSDCLSAAPTKESITRWGQYFSGGSPEHEVRGTHVRRDVVACSARTILSKDTFRLLKLNLRPKAQVIPSRKLDGRIIRGNPSRRSYGDDTVYQAAPHCNKLGKQSSRNKYGIGKSIPVAVV